MPLLSSTTPPAPTHHHTSPQAGERERDFYARLIDTANAPIFGIDASGCVNVWNRKASQVTGFKPEDVMGKDLVKEFITDENKEAVQQVGSRDAHLAPISTSFASPSPACPAQTHLSARKCER
jgi:PAS domain-containing protein